jgi:outer membrane protein OmpA-like peptidoglycan-associated protein
MDERNGGRGAPRLPLLAAALVVPAALAGLALLWPGPSSAAPAGTAAAAAAPPAARSTAPPTASRTPAPAAPAPAPELDETGKAQLRAALAAALAGAPLTFLPDSPEPTPEAAAALAAAVEVLRGRPAARLQVDGFVAAGPGEGALTAQELSDARAAAVRDALVAGGVPADRVAARGLGEGPEPRTGPAGRRVEITVV